MIEPTEADVGRFVLYTASQRARYERTGPPERGVITSFNDSYVFVRYDNFQASRATRRVDLEWEHGKDTSRPGSNGTD